MRLVINLAIFAVVFSLCWLATDNLWIGIVLATTAGLGSEAVQRMIARR